jgi:hypothetical protein
VKIPCSGNRGANRPRGQLNWARAEDVAERVSIDHGIGGDVECAPHRLHDRQLVRVCNPRYVSLDQLPSVVPAGTVYVIPEERQDQIASGKAGFNKRFAPYPQP